jgi:GNAT superfamily N-acetyltransferase
VQVIETGALPTRDWDLLIDGEPEPFGAVGEQLHWRAKTHSVCVRDDDGRPLAAGGLAVAELDVAGAPPFAVTGIGGVIVTRSMRGRGLARTVIERLIEIAPALGPQRAMLFCLERNEPLYEKFGFLPVAGPVWADQPGGAVAVPMGAMWRPLTDGAEWPEGVVHIHGEPF